MYKRPAQHLWKRLALLLAIVAIIATSVHWHRDRRKATFKDPASLRSKDAIADPLRLVHQFDITGFHRPRRPVYPYSVIAGGVTTAEELRAFASGDRTVASHYTDFNLKKARVVPLKTSSEAYVSYRLGPKIYWTRKKVRLHKGEAIITDGVRSARARCANRISDIPRKPTAPVEPPLEELDTPMEAAALRPPEDPMQPPTIVALPPGGSFPPFILPPIIVPPGSGPTDPPITVPPGSYPPPGDGVPLTPVPEPGTFLMLGSGSVALLAAARRRLQKRKKVAGREAVTEG